MNKKNDELNLQKFLVVAECFGAMCNYKSVEVARKDLSDLVIAHFGKKTKVNSEQFFQCAMAIFKEEATAKREMLKTLT